MDCHKLPAEINTTVETNELSQRQQIINGKLIKIFNKLVLPILKQVNISAYKSTKVKPQKVEFDKFFTPKKFVAPNKFKIPSKLLRFFEDALKMNKLSEQYSKIIDTYFSTLEISRGEIIKMLYDYIKFNNLYEINENGVINNRIVKADVAVRTLFSMNEEDKFTFSRAQVMISKLIKEDAATVLSTSVSTSVSTSESVNIDPNPSEIWMAQINQICGHFEGRCDLNHLRFWLLDQFTQIEDEIERKINDEKLRYTFALRDCESTLQHVTTIEYFESIIKQISDFTITPDEYFSRIRNVMKEEIVNNYKGLFYSHRITDIQWNEGLMHIVWHKDNQTLTVEKDWLNVESMVHKLKSLTVPELKHILYRNQILTDTNDRFKLIEKILSDANNIERILENVQLVRAKLNTLGFILHIMLYKSNIPFKKPYMNKTTMINLLLYKCECVNWTYTPSVKYTVLGQDPYNEKIVYNSLTHCYLSIFNGHIMEICKPTYPVEQPRSLDELLFAEFNKSMVEQIDINIFQNKSSQLMEIYVEHAKSKLMFMQITKDIVGAQRMIPIVKLKFICDVNNMAIIKNVLSNVSNFNPKQFTPDSDESTMCLCHWIYLMSNEVDEILRYLCRYANFKSSFITEQLCDRVNADARAPTKQITINLENPCGKVFTTRIINKYIDTNYLLVEEEEI